MTDERAAYWAVLNGLRLANVDDYAEYLFWATRGTVGGMWVRRSRRAAWIAAQPERDQLVGGIDAGVRFLALPA